MEKAREQTALLARAAPRVRPGGTLVYAVCTITTAETRDVMDAFLAAYPAFRPDPFADPRSGASCPAGLLTIQPWEGPCDGMFIARFRRHP